MSILFHGTTLTRAARIIAHGPDPSFVEPGEVQRAKTQPLEFSACLAFGPFPLGTPEDYAHRKSRIAEYQSEGGPAIVIFDVPDDTIALAASVFFPLSCGVVQFDQGAGLDELRANWSTIKKRIISLGCP